MKILERNIKNRIHFVGIGGIGMSGIAEVLFSQGFKIQGRPLYLRPFELASLRLQNMIEVLSNWDTYMPYPNSLTQRGGTYLLNNNNTKRLKKLGIKVFLGHSPKNLKGVNILVISSAINKNNP